jgi:hypothetical protein
MVHIRLFVNAAASASIAMHESMLERQSVFREKRQALALFGFSVPVVAGPRTRRF